MAKNKNRELKDCNIPQKFFYNLNDINELNHTKYRVKVGDKYIEFKNFYQDGKITNKDMIRRLTNENIHKNIILICLCFKKIILL